MIQRKSWFYPDLRLPVTGQWAEAQVGPGNNYITSMFVTIFRSQMPQLLSLVLLSMYTLKIVSNIICKFEFLTSYSKFCNKTIILYFNLPNELMFYSLQTTFTDPSTLHFINCFQWIYCYCKLWCKLVLKLIAFIKASIKDGFAILNFSAGKTTIVSSALSFEKIFISVSLRHPQWRSKVEWNYLKCMGSNIFCSILYFSDKFSYICCSVQQLPILVSTTPTVRHSVASSNKKLQFYCFTSLSTEDNGQLGTCVCGVMVIAVSACKARGWWGVGV